MPERRDTPNRRVSEHQVGDFGTLMAHPRELHSDKVQPALSPPYCARRPARIRETFYEYSEEGARARCCCGRVHMSRPGSRERPSLSSGSWKVAKSSTAFWVRGVSVFLRMALGMRLLIRYSPCWSRGLVLEGFADGLMELLERHRQSAELLNQVSPNPSQMMLHGDLRRDFACEKVVMVLMPTQLSARTTVRRCHWRRMFTNSIMELLSLA